MKLLLILLLLPIALFGQNLSEYQKFDWDDYCSDYYNEMYSGRSNLSKDLKRYQLFTYNSRVTQQVNLRFDTLKVRRGFKATSYDTESKWGRRVVTDFMYQFSDSLNEPVILRHREKTEGCDSCSNSICDLIISDSTMMSIIFSKKVKRTYISYFQMSQNKKWTTSYLVLYFKNRGKRTQFIWYEIPEDVKQ